ncbi:hypothetical protein PAENIP36_22180 [Paenibacillus sp. P36]
MLDAASELLFGELLVVGELLLQPTKTVVTNVAQRHARLNRYRDLEKFVLKL